MRWIGVALSLPGLGLGLALALASGAAMAGEPRDGARWSPSAGIPFVLAQQFQSNQGTPPPGAPGSIAAPQRRLPAVCTSTDGKQTCDCGEKGCVGQATTCFCFVASDPPGSGDGGRN